MDLGVLPDLAPSCIASAIPAQEFQHSPRNSPGEKGQMLCQTFRTINFSGPITFFRKGTHIFPALRPSEHTPSPVPKSRILPEVGDFGKTLHITSPSPPRSSFEIASSPSVQEHRRQQVQESRCYVHSQSQAQGSNLSWPEKIARGVGWLRVARQAAQRQHKEQNQGQSCARAGESRLSHREAAGTARGFSAERDPRASKDRICHPWLFHPCSCILHSMHSLHR